MKKTAKIKTEERASDQLNRLIESMDSYTKHKVECFCCCKTDSTRDTSEASYARELYEEGWRYVTSERLQTMGVMCPECVAIPDAKRGE